MSRLLKTERTRPALFSRRQDPALPRRDGKRQRCAFFP